MAENQPSPTLTQVGDELVESEWVSPDVAAARAGGSPDMGKSLPTNEELEEINATPTDN